MLESPGLYVHLPWCIKKCPYCDFNSHGVRDTPPYGDYVDAVCADLTDQVRRFSPSAFGSVFFGGGTPSLFEPGQIGRILDAANSLCGIASDAEITLEANPGATEHGSFSGYRRAGVNRISLGVQSFADGQLRRLGRVHSTEDTYRAVEAVQRAGFAQFNLDLMYGLPQQTATMALDDIESAIDLSPAHISHYQLTIEPNTLFAVKTPLLPDEDTCFEMQQQCQQALSSAGYEQYEVSAYARADSIGQHNLNYWMYGDYLGVGAGAHGKITTRGVTGRTQKPRHPAQYLSDPLALTLTRSTPAEHLFEYMLNRLRLSAPITDRETGALDWFETSEYRARFAQAQERGLLKKSADGAWSKTPLGQRFLNDLQEIFLP